MKDKITLILLGIILIAVFSFLIINFAKPASSLNKLEEKQLVEKYLQENISNISPEKEVLGGKFYVTKIIWLENNSAAIEYEDGHILLAATLDYEVITNEAGTGSVKIINFKIDK